MPNLGEMYQLPEDVEAAGVISVESDLLDFATGELLVQEDTQEQLTGETLDTQVLATAGNCTPIVVTNPEASPAPVDIINLEESEVSKSLLGIPRSETALVLFDTVNIYSDKKSILDEVKSMIKEQHEIPLSYYLN